MGGLLVEGKFVKEEKKRKTKERKREFMPGNYIYYSSLIKMLKTNYNTNM